MDKLWSVDRITQGVAVLEDDTRGQRQVPAARLPAGIKEGDCLRETQDGYIRDDAQTALRRAKNRDLFRRLTGRE